MLQYFHNQRDIINVTCTSASNITSQSPPGWKSIRITVINIRVLYSALAQKGVLLLVAHHALHVQGDRGTSPTSYTSSYRTVSP